MASWTMLHVRHKKWPTAEKKLKSPHSENLVRAGKPGAAAANLLSLAESHQDHAEADQQNAEPSLRRHAFA